MVSTRLGMVGASLAEKVQEAYAFIAQCVTRLSRQFISLIVHNSNYRPGDEVSICPELCKAVQIDYPLFSFFSLVSLV